MVAQLLLLPLLLLQAGSAPPAAGVQLSDVLVGAHYFAGWAKVCPPGSLPGGKCYSHFHGFSPTGAPTSDWFASDYPERTPLLGMLTTSEATVTKEIVTADAALDFFDILYYDGGADCGYNADPNLRWCLDSTLAFMLNNTAIWQNTTRLHFFISYSNDVDRNKPNVFVGPAGDAKWSALVKTWADAMVHPRYLKINQRPVFKILIPEIFIAECGDNATLATERLGELRATARSRGLSDPLIGGGWENPSVAAGDPKTARPHPGGYMLYNKTKIGCTDCDIGTASSVSSIVECQAKCNQTVGCDAIVISDAAGAPKSCQLKSKDAPGTGDLLHSTYVRVAGQVEYEWTGSYNAAPPVCPDEPNWACQKYVNSWMPNRTAAGAEVFPYKECGDYQGAARTNHSHDRVPYLANVIAGFNPRPWEEHSPSFAFPTEAEWEAVLTQVKAQCEDPANKFGFPDASKPNSYQPAFNIYAWNEYGEGGITAPTQGDGFMKVKTISRVFGR